MMTLYVRSGCGFCLRVLAHIAEHNIPLEVKEIGDETAYAELMEKGGKGQVPFLDDPERGTSMYESADIIAYLDERA